MNDWGEGNVGEAREGDGTVMDPAATRAWAKQNRAAWELTPLVEMHEGRAVQVGFRLHLYARVPTEIRPSPERRAAIIATWDRMREITDSLVAVEPPGTEVEIGPYDAEERYRRENGFRPEVRLEARIVHKDDYFEAVDAEDRDRLRPLEQKLRELGLRPGHW
jgi:hypothetical protein